LDSNCPWERVRGEKRAKTAFCLLTGVTGFQTWISIEETGLSGLLCIRTEEKKAVGY